MVNAEVFYFKIQSNLLLRRNWSKTKIKKKEKIKIF